MTLQAGLIVLIVTLLVLLAASIVLLKFVQSRLGSSSNREKKRLLDLLPAAPKEREWQEQLFRAYPLLSEIPLVSLILRRVRSRISFLHAGEERMIRIRSAGYTLITLVVVVVMGVTALVFASSWMSRFTILLAAFYVSGVISDLLIGRLQKKLLYDESSMILDIRHEYHQTHMVQVSLENAAERCKPAVAIHARQIASILSAVDPQDELQRYYDIAPNRYMKQLAGVSYRIGEYGDNDVHRGERSIYLSMLGNIREEIHLDISRRERIDRLLAGLVFVAVAPVFMLDPIRNWSESMFPIVSEYYNSAWGLYSLLTLYVTFILCFLSLRIIRGVEDNSQSVEQEGRWLNRVLERKWVKIIAMRAMPPDHHPASFKTKQRLRDASSSLSPAALALQKLLIAIIAFTLVIGVQLWIHASIRGNILEPNEAITTGGNQPEAQKELSRERYLFERKLIGELVEQGLTGKELTDAILQQTEGKVFLPFDMDEEAYSVLLAQRVMDYRSETYRWYEPLIAFLLALGAYYIPDLMLQLRTQMRKWEMQNEVDGFNTLSMMLSQFPSISVYEIIEWLHRYSFIFRRPLLRCMLDYEAGSWQALEQLKEDARFVPLERLADRLQVAADLIPVQKAFDDMEAERAFAMEQRREHYERVISRKSTLGKLVGFLPIQATFTLYLLLPFVYMAFQQLNDLNVITSKM
ncbi:hypothetical protein [Paenibacillus herberti]|uniref:Uncharacterized protein n=1 Tax=Paenibacillus herberti TaxID=1619309 RepID=A0A229NZW1_9BACL|nr:hypothetical protein [Paenibacillus herberti]OXM15546.1 hypothetical protein CGZ75_02065 [Paenibacillus herberti]